MTFERFREPLRRAFAHSVTLAAAQKLVAAFGGSLETAVEDVRHAAERALGSGDLGHEEHNQR
jgi:hypothetical protein